MGVNTVIAAQQVRTVRKVHCQPGHVAVVFGHLEPGGVDSVRNDHVPDRRVHVVDRETQIYVMAVKRRVITSFYKYIHTHTHTFLCTYRTYVRRYNVLNKYRLQ